jgi:hypothetical protein
MFHRHTCNGNSECSDVPFSKHGAAHLQTTQYGSEIILDLRDFLATTMQAVAHYTTHSRRKYSPSIRFSVVAYMRSPMGQIPAFAGCARNDRDKCGHFHCDHVFE